MISQNQELINRKIQEMYREQQCGLKELFGAEWESIGTPGERKKFGTLFKKAVADGVITGIRWVRIENSGRYDVYEKL